MKIIVELSQEDLTGYNATLEEIHDWIVQAISRPVDTWDGGMAFLDGPDTVISVKEVNP